MERKKIFMRTAGGGRFPRLARVMTLALLMLTGLATGAWAADQLTVYDGTDQNNKVPFDGFDADNYVKGEYVIPAADLSAMTGKSITAMTFYVNSSAKNTFTANMQVFMKEIDNATISSFSGTAGATTVYEGILDRSGETMTLTFATPYSYGGGNLLIGFYSKSKGTYNNVVWYGKTVSGASISGNGSNLDAISATQQDFIPKTTFTYEAAAAKYTVAMAEGTEEADKWTIDPAEGLTEGQQVVVTYSGNRRVKSVTATWTAAEGGSEEPVATPLDASTTAWTAGTYAVPAGGLTYSDAITVSGDVTLTLTDGETLTLNKGISLAEGATLTIDGTGTMVVNGTNGSTASTVAGTGTLVLTSGTLTAKGGNGQDTNQGYQNVSGNVGGVAINGAVTVSGGTLTATGGAGGRTNAARSTASAGGAAISGSVTVSSGTLTATGGNGGNTGSLIGYSHAGAGGAAIGGDLTVNGGTTTTTDGSNGVVEDPGWGDVSGAGGKAVAGTVTDNR